MNDNLKNMFSHIPNEKGPCYEENKKWYHHPRRRPTDHGNRHTRSRSRAITLPSYYG